MDMLKTVPSKGTSGCLPKQAIKEKRSVLNNGFLFITTGKNLIYNLSFKKTHLKA